MLPTAMVSSVVSTNRVTMMSTRHDLTNTASTNSPEARNMKNAVVASEVNVKVSEEKNEKDSEEANGRASATNKVNIPKDVVTSGPTRIPIVKHARRLGGASSVEETMTKTKRFPNTVEKRPFTL